jgi:hypothetical protein
MGLEVVFADGTIVIERSDYPLANGYLRRPAKERAAQLVVDIEAANVDGFPIVGKGSALNLAIPIRIDEEVGEFSQ